MSVKNIHHNNTGINFKVWIEDGIIRINTGKEKWSIETMERCTEEFNELIKKFPENPKILINVSPTPPYSHI